MPNEQRIISLWPCGDMMFWLFVLVAVIFCAGKPDLLDAIIYRVMECPKQVEQPTVLLGEEGDMDDMIHRMLEREGLDPDHYTWEIKNDEW